MAQDSSDLTKEDLEELLRPILDADGSNIEGFEFNNITKPGDNFGSTLRALDVNLSPGSRTLSLVAKMLPKSPMLREVFQCEKTVKKEIAMYQLVRPAYEKIQKEFNVPEDKYLDVFPVCHAARISSKGDSGPVDETSVILLDNLKIKGYECGDRFVGHNLEHCKLLIDKLARFHATAIALKIKKPEEFKATVLKAAAPLYWDQMKQMAKLKELESIPEYENLKERIDVALEKSCDLFASSEPPREPFATLAHIDLNTNNIMFQYESVSTKSIPKDLKLIDFQITRYDSPARDLLFFLYTSANLEVLSDHYDYIVKFYYDNFVDCLRILKCDETLFSFNSFLEEIDKASASEFWHIAAIIPGLNTASEDSFSPDNTSSEGFKKPKKLAKTFFPRTQKFVLDFASRNWI